MNRFKTYFFKLTIAMFAVGLAVSVSPVSRAEDQPSSQPATTSTTASQPATAASQPSADTQQRLQELENEVTALQSAIASLKADSAPAMKTAAYAQPAPSASAYTPPTAADDAPPKINIASLLGPVTLSGFGDAYYGYDYNHPFDNDAGLRSFEMPTNGFSFNMAELILDKAADATSPESRLGYHVSAGYGEAAFLIGQSDSPAFRDGSNFFIKEAYLDYIAPVGKGLTITVGKFVTPMGAEVIESNGNWNYTRGLLFNYAIPFLHFGANAKYTFNPKWALTGYLVNGWNNTVISHDTGTNQSSGLTYGASIAYTPNAKWSVIENYFAGPITDAYKTNGATINNWKQISDTVISYTPNTMWAFMVNGDYGFGPRSYSGTCGEAVVSEGGTPTPCTAGPSENWWGGAGYLKYTMSPKTNFAVRYEYFNDTDAYAGLLTNTFGENLGAGHAQSFTGTISYNVTSALLVRGEYRYDLASQKIFNRGFNDAPLNYQNTATLSFVYSFSSANMK